MTDIKFTFTAGLALLMLGGMLGMSADAVVSVINGISIQVTPAIAAALRVGAVLTLIIVALLLVYRGMIEPRGR